MIHGQLSDHLAEYICLQSYRRTAMSAESHLEELAQKHKLLDRKIDMEAARPGSRDEEIRRLKQEKLQLKDEIERLRAATRH